MDEEVNGFNDSVFTEHDASKSQYLFEMQENF